MDFQSERQLVEAANNGDLDCFGVLYRRYYSIIVALAYSVLADRHLAEDAAQQAFVIACRDLPKLKRKDKFASWLAGICRNIAMQMTKTKDKVIALDEPAEAANNAEQDRRAEIIRRAVRKLRPADRELILLRYYNSWSYARISAVLGISRQAVNGRLFRAKRKITKHLKRNGFTGAEL